MGQTERFEKHSFSIRPSTAKISYENNYTTYNEHDFRTTINDIVPDDLTCSDNQSFNRVSY